MREDEFAFLNRQLAGMLHSGLPLEGALKKLSMHLNRGRLREELSRLEGALSRGEGFAAALERSTLPELYQRMVRVSLRAGNLPGMLTLLADYYQRLHSLRTRLKGLLVYPSIVLAGCIALSLFLTFLSNALSSAVSEVGTEFQQGQALGVPYATLIWLPLIFLSLLGAGVVVVLCIPAVRHRLRWMAPGFREASLAQTAASVAMMLRGGTPLPDALEFSAVLEPCATASRELRRWKTSIEQGERKFGELARSGKIFPPLFFWLVEDGGEDLVHGFRRAADIYYARSQYLIEILLYAALPVSVIFLGAVIVGQIVPVIGISLGQGSIRDFFQLF